MCFLVNYANFLQMQLFKELIAANFAFGMVCSSELLS